MRVCARLWDEAGGHLHTHAHWMRLIKDVKRLRKMIEEDLLSHILLDIQPSPRKDLIDLLSANIV